MGQVSVAPVIDARGERSTGWGCCSPSSEQFCAYPSAVPRQRRVEVRRSERRAARCRPSPAAAKASASRTGKPVRCRAPRRRNRALLISSLLGPPPSAAPSPFSSSADSDADADADAVARSRPGQKPRVPPAIRYRTGDLPGTVIHPEQRCTPLHQRSLTSQAVSPPAGRHRPGVKPSSRSCARTWRVRCLIRRSRSISGGSRL